MWVFGFRRLSIVNYDNGHQNILKEVETLYIVDNHKEFNHLRSGVILIEKRINSEQKNGDGCTFLKIMEIIE